MSSVIIGIINLAIGLSLFALFGPLVGGIYLAIMGAMVVSDLSKAVSDVKTEAELGYYEYDGDTKLPK